MAGRRRQARPITNAESSAAGPSADQCSSAELSASESSAAECRTAEPSAAGCRTAEPSATECRTAEPSATECRTAEPSATECRTAEPSAAECSAAASRTGELSAAQRARIERNRLHARALHEARLVARSQSNTVEGTKHIHVGKVRAVDTGGGFLVEAVAEAEGGGAGAGRAQHAPLVHASQQPRCEECQRLFPQSYLFDTFDFSVCDDCRDESGAHGLVTRTEAKTEFLLKDCDLDSRPPPLRCVRRRNPHRARYSDMRLYLRAQVEQRALLVWGSEERLLQERAARDQRRERAHAAAARRRLTALRMAVRSSLYDGTHAPHEHSYAEESYDPAADLYTRVCRECGHTQTYEKM